MWNQQRLLLFYAALFCSHLQVVHRVRAIAADEAQNIVEETVEVAQTTSDGSHQVGDIIFSNISQEDNLEGEFSHIWLNRTVYYTFEQNLSFEYRALFVEAMSEWSAFTCILFQLAERGQDHILFSRDDQRGCASYVGRKGGAQVVSMTDYCLSKGDAMHLIGYAIGLWPEHSRPDRDEYITVHYENMADEDRDKFAKLNQEKFNLVPDVGYDIESIMHYGPYAFSKESSSPDQPTIRLREDAPLDYKNCLNLLSMGQRDQLSYLDKLRANKLYSCHEHVHSLETVGGGRTCITPEPPMVTTEISTSISPRAYCPLASNLSLSPINSGSSSSVHRLKSGTVIALQWDNGSKGLRCSPKCRPKMCSRIGIQSSCHMLTYQFEIVTIDQDTKKVKSGRKVALRSRCNPTKWLDCNNPDSECSITKCTKCIGEICTYGDYSQPCDRHHFIVYGVGRREEGVLNTNYEIYFGREGTDALLTCSGSVCRMSAGVPLEEDGTQSFTFTIFN